MRAVPSGLLCDDRENPLGVDVLRPWFSFHWEPLPDQAQPEIPDVFRIRVSGSEEALLNPAGDLWNSGWLSSGETLRVQYHGKPLRSGERYSWLVETRQGSGEPGPSSATAWFEMGLLAPEDWKASWIMGVAETFPQKPSDLACGYRHGNQWELDWVNGDTGDYAGESPLFRREFAIGKPVLKARLYFCGLGWSEAYINGSKVGDDVHSPAVSDYDDRNPELIIGHDLNPHRRYRGRRHYVLYRMYDVTAMLKAGRNALGLWLGNGYYNDPLQRMGAKPRTICQLEITYGDGGKDRICSNRDDWKTAPSPIVYNEMVLGEVYDARKEAAGWSLPDFDASSWENAHPAQAPSDQLRVQTCPPDKVVKTYEPVLIAGYRDGVTLYDIGDQIAGWVTIRVRGRKGDRVDIRFAQNYLCGELRPQQEKISKLTYILRGEGVETYQPRFMWAGFRYVEVTTRAEIVHLEGQKTATRAPHTGHFSCSNELWNRLYTAAVKTMSNHFQVGLPMDDCHLERRAYTNVGTMNSSWGIASFDSATVYRKWLGDIANAQHLELGYIPETVPYQCGTGNLYGGMAIIEIPYNYYLHRGDREILATYMDAMERWMEFMAGCTDGDFIIHRTVEGLPFIGDWLWPGQETLKDKSISTIDVSDVPMLYVNSCFYAYQAGRMIEIKKALGQDASKYVALKANLDKAIRDKWYHPESHTYSSGRRGSEALALWADVVPEEERQAVADAMASHIVEKCRGHLDTGCFTTPALISMLTRYGHAAVAAGIMSQTTYPSHGFMIQNGHPTIWEYFEGVRNNNQPIFATYVDWMLREVLGIRPDPQRPGYRNIILNPLLLNELSRVEGHLHTPLGKVGVRWEKSREQTTLKAEIPLGSTGQIRVPDKDREILVDGKKVRPFDKDGCPWITITSGEHTVTFKK